MSFQCLQFEEVVVDEGKIGVLRFSRPEALNALNQQTLMELEVFLEEMPRRTELRACILTGAGDKAFVAGADIKEMEKINEEEGHAMAVRGQALFQAIEDLPIPVIAAVNGFALGGGLELALSCDFMIASSKAKWGLPEVTLGLIPGYGGTQRLTRNLGRTLARRVAMSGEIFSAEQGLAWGLFTQVVEPADLMPTAMTLGKTLTARAPLALRWAKQAINQGHNLELSEGMALEAKLFARTFATQDHNEGIQAFLSKRKPAFRGV